MAEELEEVMVVTLTSPDGEEKDYQEVDEVVIDGKLFSLLMEICDNEEDADWVIARVSFVDEEPIYEEPTEEEFEAARMKFEELFAEEEAAEE